MVTSSPITSLTAFIAAISKSQIIRTGEEVSPSDSDSLTGFLEKLLIGVLSYSRHKCVGNGDDTYLGARV